MERFYKVHEGFDLSGMSDIDYTDTFADIDMEAENLVLFKNWVGECINAGIKLRTDISGGLIIWFDQRNFKKAVSVIPSLIPSLPDGFIIYPNNYIISAVTKDAILAVLDISPAGDSYSVTVNPGKVFQNATVLYVWMLFAPGDAGPLPYGADGWTLSPKDSEMCVFARPDKNGTLIGCPADVYCEVFEVGGCGFLGQNSYGWTTMCYAEGRRLKSFEGSPRRIHRNYYGGNFIIRYNDPSDVPDSFAGCPEVVDGDVFVAKARISPARVHMSNMNGFPVKVGGNVNLKYVNFSALDLNGNMRKMTDDGIHREIAGSLLLQAGKDTYSSVTQERSLNDIIGDELADEVMSDIKAKNVVIRC